MTTTSAPCVSPVLMCVVDPAACLKARATKWHTTKRNCIHTVDVCRSLRALLAPLWVLGRHL